ncbi:MAG: transposase [Planctomycetaceae bacterium]|nr:transposase [Planctomycetaceae bacterium]
MNIALTSARLGRTSVPTPRRTCDAEQRVRFSPGVLPPYLRRSRSLDELIPRLYLKGISTGDFSEALQSLPACE